MKMHDPFLIGISYNFYRQMRTHGLKCSYRELLKKDGEEMESSVFAERLMEFGLTRQEAAIYECLLREGKTTG